jgi:hypothetical protein
MEKKNVNLCIFMNICIASFFFCFYIIIMQNKNYKLGSMHFSEYAHIFMCVYCFY